MTTLESILLGVVQGLTEFLPVSSSGHNVLASNLIGASLDPDQSVAVNVMLHLGSLVAILIVFRRDVLALALPRPNWKRILLLGYVSVPAAVVGILLGDWLDSVGYMNSVAVVCVALLVTALLLVLAEQDQSERVTLDSLSLRDWLLAGFVGVMQAVAITPGISRSGSTIAVALMLGWARADAVRLSFLMGLIAIGGAGILKAREISDLALAPAFGGFVASLVFSLLGLAGIRFVVRERKLRWFAAYCAAVGLIGLTWLAFF